MKFYRLFLATVLSLSFCACSQNAVEHSHDGQGSGSSKLSGEYLPGQHAKFHLKIWSILQFEYNDDKRIQQIQEAYDRIFVEKAHQNSPASHGLETSASAGSRTPIAMKEHYTAFVKEVLDGSFATYQTSSQKVGAIKDAVHIYLGGQLFDSGL